MENPAANSTSQNEANIHEFFRQLLAERDAKLRQMADELNQLRLQKQAAPAIDRQAEAAEAAALLAGLRSENERLQTSYSIEKTDLIQQLARRDDEVKKLREETHIFRNASLKASSSVGGARWFAAVLLSAIVGAGAFFYAKLKFQKTEPPQAIFEKYRDQRLFQFEYDINQGQFEKVEAAIDKDLADPQLAAIRPQIEVLRKVIRASGGFASEKGVAAKPASYVAMTERSAEKPAASPDKKEKKKTLTIAYDTPVTLRHEATTGSEAIRKLADGTVLTVLDRTFTRDKVKTTIDGNRCELRDYWYKVETKEEETGWVFGYFTSRSQKLMFLLDSAGEPIVPEKTAEQLPSPTTSEAVSVQQ